MNGDNAEGGDPDLAHMVGRVKKRQQRTGNELKERQANEHQTDRGNDGQADGFLYALGLSRAVVVGDDRDHAVIEAEDRHEDKALELEVDAEDGRRCGGKDDEDLVEAEVHDRTDGHHDDRGNADPVNFLDGIPVEADVARADADIGVKFEVHKERKARRNDLADDGRHRRAGNLHARKAEPAEDENRVQNDVDDRAGDLRVHRKLRPPGRLQQPLEAELRENADRRAKADRGVARAVVHDLLHICLREEEGARERQAQHAEDCEIAEHQEDGRVGRAVDEVVPLCTQSSGQQCVCADGRAASEGNHQILQWESQRDGAQRVFIQLRDIDAVDNVIKCLHQHRDHHGNRHVGKKLSNRHRAHFVFRSYLFHTIRPFRKNAPKGAKNSPRPAKGGS